MYEAVQRAIMTEQLTLRVIRSIWYWVGHKTIVGTPEQVADEMIEWFEKSVRWFYVNVTNISKRI